MCFSVGYKGGGGDGGMGNGEREISEEPVIDPIKGCWYRIISLMLDTP